MFSGGNRSHRSCRFLLRPLLVSEAGALLYLALDAHRTYSTALGLLTVVAPCGVTSVRYTVAPLVKRHRSRPGGVPAGK